MGGPAWLNDLRPLDRRRAELWLAQVGEQRFLAIAAAATAQKRAKNRPPSDNTAFIRFAAIHWLMNNKLDQAQAARAAAKILSLSPEKLPHARAVLTHAGLRRVMVDGLGKMTAGQLAAIQKDIRNKVLSPLHSRAANTTIMTKPRYSSRLQTPDRFGVTLVGMPLAQSDRMRRISLIARALTGLVDERTPISRLSALFDDLVASLK